MATAKSEQPAEQDPHVIGQPARAATVAQQRYAAESGWEVGQGAPKDQWRKLNPQGQLEGKPLDKAPAGEAAVQVAIKGVPVTNAVRAELGLDD
jgi:hypothetical protein